MSAIFALLLPFSPRIRCGYEKPVPGFLIPSPHTGRTFTFFPIPFLPMHACFWHSLSYFRRHPGLPSQPQPAREISFLRDFAVCNSNNIDARTDHRLGARWKMEILFSLFPAEGPAHLDPFTFGDQLVDGHTPSGGSDPPDPFAGRLPASGEDPTAGAGRRGGSALRRRREDFKDAPRKNGIRPIHLDKNTVHYRPGIFRP
jgi:hypothetical protein